MIDAVRFMHRPGWPAARRGIAHGLDLSRRGVGVGQGARLPRGEAPPRISFICRQNSPSRPPGSVADRYSRPASRSGRSAPPFGLLVFPDREDTDDEDRGIGHRRGRTDAGRQAGVARPRRDDGGAVGRQRESRRLRAAYRRQGRQLRRRHPPWRADHQRHARRWLHRRHPPGRGASGGQDPDRRLQPARLLQGLSTQPERLEHRFPRRNDPARVSVVAGGEVAQHPQRRR